MRLLHVLNFKMLATWYGHVARREETHWPQRTLNFPVAGRKPCGRPRKTWGETITEDSSKRLIPLSQIQLC